MTHRVGVPVHHEKCRFPTRDNEMLGIVARAGRFREEVRIAFFLLEILNPPRTPERFYFFLWKFR
jgi:hypothetical protein